MDADRDHDVLLVDCLTIWISNLLVGGATPDAVADRDGALLDVLRAAPGARRHRQQRGRHGPDPRDPARPPVPRSDRPGPPAPRAAGRRAVSWPSMGVAAAAPPSRGDPVGRVVKVARRKVELQDGLVAAFAFLTRLPVWRGPLRDADLGPFGQLLPAGRAGARARRSRAPPRAVRIPGAVADRRAARGAAGRADGRASPRRRSRTSSTPSAAGAATARACSRSCGTAASAPTARRR